MGRPLKDDRAGESTMGALLRIGGLAVTLMVLGGCAQPKPPLDEPPGPLPTVSDVVARYNARVERLEAIESPIELVVTAMDSAGKATREQGEGNLKMVRPRQVALRVDKVSQTFFWLGSNDERYWWFDLRGDEKVALIGTHEKARAEVAARFGLPVHPADLLDLAGVAPLVEGDVAGALRWASDGKHVVLELPGRWGAKRLTIDPVSGEASRVEMLSLDQSVVASSRLEGYVRVPVRGSAAASARMATRVFAEVPSAKATVELIIHTPVNNGAERIKPANFDYVDLKKRMGIEREVDLDSVREETSAAGTMQKGP